MKDRYANGQWNMDRYANGQWNMDRYANGRWTKDRYANGQWMKDRYANGRKTIDKMYRWLWYGYAQSMVGYCNTFATPTPPTTP